MVGQHTAVDHVADHIRFSHFFDDHGNKAIVDEDARTDAHIARQALKCHGSDFFITLDIPCGQGVFLPRVDLHGLMIAERAQTDLGAAGIEHGGDGKPRLFAQFHKLLKTALMNSIIPMGKVKARHVHARAHHAFQDAGFIGRRTYSTDDFGFSHT